MKRIYEAVQRIRHVSNEIYDVHFHVRPTAWGEATAALDVLGDTCEALLVYEHLGLGQNPGDQYLRLYGLLQGVFLQQEAIRALCRVFLGHDIKPGSDTNWGQIRTIRNMSVAHPISPPSAKNKEARFIAISRITLTDEGFDLYGWNGSERDHVWITVDLPGAYEGYKQDALKYLLQVQGVQRDRWGREMELDPSLHPEEGADIRGC